MARCPMVLAAGIANASETFNFRYPDYMANPRWCPGDACTWQVTNQTTNNTNAPFNISLNSQGLPVQWWQGAGNWTGFPLGRKNFCPGSMCYAKGSAWWGFITILVNYAESTKGTDSRLMTLRQKVSFDSTYNQACDATARREFACLRTLHAFLVDCV